MASLKLEQVFEDEPLRLLGTARWEIPADRCTKQLEAEKIVEVGDKVKLIHLAVTTAELEYGTRAANEPKQVAAIWFAATQDRDEDGKLVIEDGKTKIFFEAVLQNKSDKLHTDPWSGRFVVEVMCFG